MPQPTSHSPDDTGFWVASGHLRHQRVRRMVTPPVSPKAPAGEPARTAR